MICRICRESTPPLLNVCRCSGSIGYIHLVCLQNWIETSECWTCEICKERYSNTLTNKMVMNNVIANVIVLVVYCTLTGILFYDILLYSCICFVSFECSFHLDNERLNVTERLKIMNKFLMRFSTLILIHPVFLIMALLFMNMYIAYVFGLYYKQRNLS